MLIRHGGAVHRYTALTLLLVLIFIVVIAIWLLIELRINAKQEFESRVEDLVKYQTIVNRLPLLQTKNEAFKQLLSQQKLTLPIKEQSIAIAELQGELRQLTQQNAIRLMSIQGKFLPNDNQSFSTVSMKLQLQTTHEKLKVLLHKLEGRTPLGFIDSLIIQKDQRRSQFSQKEPANLTVKLDYRVYMESENNE